MYETDDKFKVISTRDIMQYLSIAEQSTLLQLLVKIDRRRKETTKENSPQYYIINTKEPYALQVKQLIREHYNKEDT